MILISSSKLEQHLAQNSLSSWEKTKYIILTTALYSFSGPIYILTPSFGSKPPVWDVLFSFLSSIAAVLITFWGIKKCHLMNKTFDDIHFIERFTILNIPMTIKFMALLLPLFLLFAFFSTSWGGDKETRTEIMSYSMRIMVPIGMIAYYIFLNRSFQRLGTLIKNGNRP